MKGRTTASARLAAVFALAMALALALPALAWADEGGQQAGLTAGSVATQAKSKAAAKVAKKKAKATVACTTQTVKVDVASSTRRVVDNGTYYVTSAQDMRQVMGLSSGNARMKALAYTASQKWKLNFTKSTQAYTIVNAETGKALAVKGSAKSGAGVQMVGANSGSRSQQWKIVSTATGYVVHPAANVKLRLTVGANGALKLAGAKASGVQHFWLVGSSGTKFLKSGTYSLSTASGKLLSVPSMAIHAGHALKVASNADNLGQVWDVTYLANGYFKIINVNSGMAATAKGTSVTQEKYKGAPAQKWKATLRSDGSVKFINMSTRRALDLRGNSVKNIKSSSARASQDWTLSPAAPGINSVGKKALWKANTRRSQTKYACVCDLTMHELFIFQKVDKSKRGGPWKLLKTCRVSSGAHGSWTYARESIITGHKYNDPRFNCFYWSTIGGGSFFHSLLYASRSYPNRITDGRLGMYISHGCIRMPIEYAKWIYDNCGYGTAVSRYY